MGLIYLVRHAENLANLERTFSWRVVDHPLTARGRWQAQALAAWFGQRCPPIARIYSSPLRRAVETAALIAAATGAPLGLTEALRELGVGMLDGRADAAAWATHDGIIARWWQDDWEARFPAGESYRDVYERLAALLDFVLQRHPAEDVVVVGHGGLFCSVLPRLCPIPDAARLPILMLDNSAVTLLRYDAGGLVCDHWNSLAHLRDAGQPPAD